MKLAELASRMIVSLLGAGMICAHVRPPKIIEMHKDSSISDEDRIYDLESSHFDLICKSFKRDCFRDTAYWIVSRSLFSNETAAWKKLRKDVSMPIEEYQKRGIGIFSRDELPLEVKNAYASHFFSVVTMDTRMRRC